MREQTATLVGSVKDEISGDDAVPPEMSLQRAWTAYRLARFKDDDFGARSFGWIALGCIFDAIKEIETEEEEAERTSARRQVFPWHYELLLLTFDLRTELAMALLDV